MLSASKAITIDENFGPILKSEEAMPSIQRSDTLPFLKDCTRDVAIDRTFKNLHWLSGGRPRDTVYLSVAGLGGVPDAPHAVMSEVAEGSGVGIIKEPTVNAKSSYFGHLRGLAKAQVASNLCFKVEVVEGLEVTWETMLVDGKLFVEIPSGILPEGSKEGLVTLLEFAEEKLQCKNVIIFFRRDRNNRSSLIKTFMFLGFEVVSPGNSLVPNIGDLIFMAYTIADDNDLSD